MTIDIVNICFIFAYYVLMPFCNYSCAVIMFCSFHLRHKFCFSLWPL